MTPPQHTQATSQASFLSQGLMVQERMEGGAPEVWEGPHQCFPHPQSRLDRERSLFPTLVGVKRTKDVHLFLA